LVVVVLILNLRADPTSPHILQESLPNFVTPL
jgi:hypothetical protein